MPYIPEIVDIIRSVSLVSADILRDVNTLDEVANTLSTLIKTAIESPDPKLSQQMVERLCTILPLIIPRAQENQNSYSIVLQKVLNELETQLQDRSLFEADKNVVKKLKEIIPLMRFGYYDLASHELENLNTPKIEKIKGILKATSEKIPYNIDFNNRAQIEQKLSNEILLAEEEFKQWTLLYPNSSEKRQMVDKMYIAIARLEDVARYHPLGDLRQEALTCLQGLLQNKNLSVLIHNRLQESPVLTVKSAPARLESNWSETQPASPHAKRKEMLLAAKRAPSSIAPSSSPAAAAAAPQPETKWKPGKKPGE